MIRDIRSLRSLRSVRTLGYYSCQSRLGYIGNNITHYESLSLSSRVGYLMAKRYKTNFLCGEEYYYDEMKKKKSFSVDDALTCANRGYLETLKLILRDNKINNENIRRIIINKAIENGHLEILNMLRSKNIHSSTIKCAIDNGHIHILESIIGDTLNIDYCYRAAVSGKFDTLKWLVNKYHNHKHSKACDGAVLSNRQDILEWLVAHRFAITLNTLYLAGQYGRYDMISWLLSNHRPIIKDYDSIMLGAADGGFLGIVKWMDSNISNMNPIILAKAAEKGHFDIVKWLYDNGYKTIKTAYKNAAKNNHFDILKWIYHKDISRMTLTEETINLLDEEVLCEAVKSGNLEMVKWLRDNDCPWNISACQIAYEENIIEILEWLIRNNCPCPDHIFNLFFK